MGTGITLNGKLLELGEGGAVPAIVGEPVGKAHAEVWRLNPYYCV
jgi:hypothetical protein